MLSGKKSLLVLHIPDKIDLYSCPSFLDLEDPGIFHTNHVHTVGEEGVRDSAP